MKKFLCATALLSILLTPLSSEGDEVNPNADPRPCRIMVEQIKSFLKKDPQKGYSEPYVADWPPDTKEDKKYLFRRAFAPGIGKAVLLKPTIVIEEPTENFEKYLSNERMRFSKEYLSDSFSNVELMFSNYPAVVFDLSKSSGYIVMASLGGTLYCIRNDTFSIVQKDNYRELQESGPNFGEGELCRPSDFTIVQMAGKDYTLVNNTTITGDWELDRTKKGEFFFDIHLYPIGFIKDYSFSYDDPKVDKPTCRIEAQFNATDEKGGVLKKIALTP